MKKRTIGVVDGEGVSVSLARILLPAGILLLLTGEAYPDKCRLWIKAGLPSNLTNLSIDCYNVDMTNLDDLKYLDWFFGRVPQPSHCLSLSLVNFKYPEGVLPDGWFCSPGILNLNIQSLRIEGGLSSLAADGLRCLPVLDSLILSETNIYHLWKKPFHNVPNLRRLELDSNGFLATADPDFLSALTRLTTLHVTNLDADMQNFLRNLTSDDLQIETIDWSNSNLGQVPPEVLSRLPKLKHMDLRSTRLRSIGDNFNDLTHLKILTLCNNDIQVIPETNRKLIERLSGLFLRKNPVLCNCDMVWLQRYIKEKRNGTYGDFNEVFCAEPEELKNVRFLKARMCESPRPPPEYPTIEITCQSAGNNKTRRFKVAKEGNAIGFDKTVTIEGMKQNFTVIHDETTDRVSITINNVAGQSKTLLYWHNKDTSRPTYKCVTDVTDAFTVSMHYDTNYIICVFDKSDEVTLSDCKPFRTEKPYSDRVWLTNNMKSQVSVIAVVLLPTVLLSGGGFVYFLLMYNPSLLRGSKRVITVKSYKRPSVIILPKGYNSDTRAQLQLGRPDYVSDDTGSTASYISAIPPEPSEMLECRLEELRKYAMPYPLPRPS